MIELTEAEWKTLARQAGRERRTPQAEAASLLVGTLAELEEKAADAAADEAERSAESDRVTELAHRIQRELAEANGSPPAAGGALPPQQQVGAVEGHGDGSA